MTDRSCDCCSEVDTVSDDFFTGLLVGATTVVIFFAASHLIEKNKQQRGEIEKLISRLEECEKIKNWFMLSVRISSYGCTREVWKARKKRKSCSRRSREQL